MFSSFGPVQKIAMFDKNGGVQALIQYPGNFRVIFFYNMMLLFFFKVSLSPWDAKVMTSLLSWELYIGRSVLYEIVCLRIGTHLA